MRKDGIVGLLLLLMSGWVFLQTREIPHPPFTPLGPAFYPRVLLALLGLLSLFLIASDLTKGWRRRGVPEEERVPMPLKAWIVHSSPVLACFTTTFAYVVLLPILGYPLSTGLFVASLFGLLGPKRLKQVPLALLTGVATAALTYWIFEVYLRTLLPRGILF